MRNDPFIDVDWYELLRSATSSEAKVSAREQRLGGW